MVSHFLPALPALPYLRRFNRASRCNPCSTVCQYRLDKRTYSAWSPLANAVLAAVAINPAAL
jgi:hypothetical protein